MADSAADNDARSLSFEEALRRLEEIVEQLEGGELPLEDSLVIFEEGVALSRRCAEELGRAEQRIEKLVDKENGPAREPFDAAPADAAASADKDEDIPF